MTRLLGILIVILIGFVFPFAVVHGSSFPIISIIRVGGSPDGVIVDSTSGNVYVTDGNIGNLTVVSGSTAQVIGSISIGSASGGGAFDSFNGQLYVPNFFAGTVSVINDTSNTVTATISVGLNPARAIFDPQNRNVYVSMYGLNEVAVISDTSNTVTRTVPVGPNPAGLVLNPRSDLIYVANFGSNTVSVFDSSTNTPASTLFVGSQPDGVALDPMNNNIYVTNYHSNSVSIISGFTNSIVKTVSVGSSPEYVAFSPKTCSLYVTNRFSNTTSVISSGTLSVVDTITVGANPRGIAFNPATGEIYVANNGDGTLSVLAGQVLCSSLLLSPTKGPVGTKVEVQGSGFPSTNFNPNQIVVSFDDQFLGIAVNSNGNFAFTFNIPESQPGLHVVKALDSVSGATVVANFTVTSTNTLSVNVDVGTLYFPGDSAVVYTLATFGGSPLNSTSLQMKLTLTRPDGTVVSLNSSFLGAGLFKAAYAIPKSGPVGTYAVVSKVHVLGVQDMSALATFEVKPTWLSSQSPMLTTAAIALTGVAAVAAVVWKKRYVETQARLKPRAWLNSLQTSCTGVQR